MSIESDRDLMTGMAQQWLQLAREAEAGGTGQPQKPGAIIPQRQPRQTER